MPIKSILAYLPSQDSVGPVLDAALLIGGEQNAHVIGLHVTPTYPIYRGYAAMLPEDVIEQMNRPGRELAEAVRKGFEARMDANIISCEWRNLSADLDEVASFVIAQAHSADLVICPKRDDAILANAPSLPDRLITESGRPVLLLPKTAPAPHIGRRVLIAWNNRREAARAVFDSLDLIKGAELARLVTFIDNESQRSEAQNAGADLVASLARHNINATFDVNVAGESSVGDYLLSRIADEGCDLLVMGCYGHSRFREMIMGGVTRKILDETWIPTLMSH